ncbi:unnamed protein product [Blepharisma stoltei]|uniref:Uncharacterized protein n=1 Tax=Blepharisma stoltei TaxID=1481888 RepID=A0AAU9JH67_9CILI|nr:unnamed protein product [Blepharisma stoltei]
MITLSYSSNFTVSNSTSQSATPLHNQQLHFTIISNSTSQSSATPQNQFHRANFTRLISTKPTPQNQLYKTNSIKPTPN